MRTLARTPSACVLGCFLWSGSANAAPSSQAPQMRFRDCVAGDVADITRLVAIDAVSSAGNSEVAATTVLVVCRGGTFDVEVTRPAGGRTTRSIDLQQTAASARTRLVSIAVVELLLADAGNDARPAAPAPPSDVPVPPQAAAPLRDVTRKEAPCCSVRAEAIASARAFYGGVALVGGGVRALLGRSFPLGIDVVAEYGAPSTSEGTVSILSVTLGATYGAEVALGATHLRAAAGVRGGASHLNGRPDDATLVLGASRWAGWGGPMVEVGLTWPMLTSVVTELALEAGYPLFPVYALVSNQRELGLHGAWLGAKLGVGFGR
jgi:hypothetical protein